MTPKLESTIREWERRVHSENIPKPSHFRENAAWIDAFPGTESMIEFVSTWIAPKAIVRRKGKTAFNGLR